MVPLLLALVEFSDGSMDWLSLEGLAFYQRAGRVARFILVTP